MTPLRDALDLANIVMLFLLGTVGVALKLGRGPAALAAVLNVAAFDFFFVPPRLSFAVSDVQYLVTFAVMLVVGLLTGQLTAGLRFQARHFVGARAAGAIAVRAHARVVGGAGKLTSGGAGPSRSAAELRRAGFGAHHRCARPAGRCRTTRRRASTLAWPTGLFATRKPAGLATSTLAAQPWHYVPLKAPMRVRGVLALQPP